MKKPEGLNDISRSDLIELIRTNERSFQRAIIRPGDLSTSIYFFNTRNSVNLYINIDNKLIAEYELDFKMILKNYSSGL
jgi:hypothetical protein